MMIKERAIRSEREKSIVQSSAARAACDLFGYTDNKYDVQLRSDSRDGGATGPTDIDALGRQATKHRLRGLVVPESCISTEIEPDGVTWEPSLGEDHKFRAGASRFPRQHRCAFQTLREGWRYLGLHNRDARYLRHSVTIISQRPWSGQREQKISCRGRLQSNMRFRHFVHSFAVEVGAANRQP